MTLLLQDGSNRTFEVKPGSNIIGRGTISDFRLPDTGVSRQHAEITWDGRDAVLVDDNGTRWLRTGDVGHIDHLGYLTLTDRAKDVIKSGGEWISSVDLENALMAHDAVAEAAVVGAADPQTTQAICAFVILRGTAAEDEGLVDELRQHVAKQLGPIAKPKRILPVAELPKTRSGKIMRRLLKNIAEGEELGDTTTLVDPTVVEVMQKQVQGS